MQKVLLFALFCLALVSAQPAPRAPRAPREWWINTKSVILKSGTFNDHVGKDKIVVVQFLAQFSNDCKALLPEWDKLAEMYSGATPKRNDVVIALIDGWTSNSVSQSYGVTTFPNIMIFGKGDAQTQTRYAGEKTAEKISEWIEQFANGQIAPDQPAGQAPAADNTAQAQPPQQQNTPPTDNAQAPPQQAQQAQAAPPTPPPVQQTPPPVQQTPPPVQQTTPPPVQQTPPPPQPPRDVNVVLDTNLLKTQFDELQRHTSTLNEALQASINDNFQKVEALRIALETHKQDLNTVGNNVRSYIQKFDEAKQHTTNQKDEIHKAVTAHTEKQVTELKDAIQQIRNKVFEKKVEEPQESGFGSGTVLFIVGGLIGAAVTFVALNASGNRNRRKLLID